MPWCDLVAYRIEMTDKLFLVKMGKHLESICMEGQGHIFMFDLIFSGLMYHAEGSWVQSTVFYSINLSKDTVNVFSFI